MGSQNFMADFLTGWNQGLQVREEKRREELMRRQAEQEMYNREQEAMDRALKMEALKVQKAEAEQAIKRQRLQDAMTDMQTRSAAMQINAMPAPTAADVGVQQAVPDVGPPVEQIQVNRPSVSLPALMGGPDIQMGILTPREQEAQALAEQQKKMREALGLLDAQEQIKAQYRQPERPVSVSPGGILVDPNTGKVIFRAPEKAAAGGEATGGMSYGTAKAESEKKAVDTARFALGKMPEWQSYIQEHQDIFGPVAGRITQFRQSGLLPNGLAATLGMSVDPEIAKRQAEFAVMRNNMINSLSGAAVSPAEFERLKQQIPELTDDPVVVQQKLSVLNDYFQQKLQAYNIQSPGAAPPTSGGKTEDPLGIR